MTEPYIYDPPEEGYLLVAPEGKRLHFPRADNPMRPLCGLHSGFGWEKLSKEWNHLFAFCQRCSDYKEKDAG